VKEQVRVQIARAFVDVEDRDVADRAPDALEEQLAAPDLPLITGPGTSRAAPYLQRIAGARFDSTLRRRGRWPGDSEPLEPDAPMRGHRSRAVAAALTLLFLGAVGVSSFGQDRPAPESPDDGSWGLLHPDAVAAASAGHALALARGVGGPPAEERSESGEGGADRPVASGISARRIVSRPGEVTGPRPPRVASVGARLLGLPAAPANAPPRS